jgi:hypothetical protein
MMKLRPRVGELLRREDAPPNALYRAVGSGLVWTAAVALGAIALGAVAIGTLAVSRLAIGRVGIGKARIGDLEVGTLTINRLLTRERELFTEDDFGVH